MFKRLRARMTAFNTVILAAIIAAAFSVIFIVTFSNMESETDRRLTLASQSRIMTGRQHEGGFLPSDFPTWEGTPPFQASEDNPVLAADYSVSFVLYIKDDALIYIDSRRLDYDDGFYNDAYSRVAGDGEGKLTLGDKRWAYKTYKMQYRTAGGPGGIGVPTVGEDSEQYTKIVFLDITDNVVVLKHLALTLGLVWVAVTLLLFCVIYAFVSRAVLPIEENYNKQRQFIADASHEFRTPLAVIGANMDVLELNAEETVESQTQWLGYIRAELDRAGKLVNDLLILARSEGDGIIRRTSEPFDMSQTCRGVSAAVEALLYEKGITYDDSGIEDGVTAHGDSDKFAQVLYILYDNAGKYTPEGGSVSAVVRREHAYAVFALSNTASEISKEDLSRIFDRFYRCDSSRSAETGGSGLGLSIAKTVITAMGGEIRAEYNDGVVTFFVKLKLS